MFNNPKVTGVKAGGPKQILANVELQASVGCRVPASLGVAQEDGRKLALAGTPIHVDFSDLSKAVTAPSSSVSANAVLLHDVDVTDGGTKNGTALYFGMVNINRLDSVTKAKVTAGVNTIGAVTFMAV